jgi:hypothetical protein
MKKAYLRDGRAVEVRGKLDGKNTWVVSEILESMDYEGNSEEYTNEITFLVDKVYDTPPVKQYNQEIKALKDEIQKLQAESLALESKIYDLDEGYKSKIKKLKKYSALKHIEDFVEEKITHYVVQHYGSPEIITQEEIRMNDRYDNGFRLLSLFGKSNGDLEWRLSHYSDGSGGYTEVFPCLSLDDAKANVQEYIDALNPEKDTPYKDFIEQACKWDLKLPEWYIPKYKERAKKNALQNILDAEKALLQRRQELSEIEKQN